MKIRVEGVSIAFHDRLRASFRLNDINLVIDSGTFTCLLGTNGAGKTTLLRMMTGQLKPNRGRVEVADDSGAILSLKEAVRSFAILPQGVQDPPYLTIRELVSLGRNRPGNGLGWRLGDSDMQAVYSCLRKCGIEDKEDRRFDELSGGEKQRAWLAFCLAQEKRFLVLDESLQGLDFLAKRDFFQLLKGIAEGGAGVLLTTHDLQMASQFGGRLIALKDGNLCYDGPPLPDLEHLLIDRKQTEAVHSR